MFSSSRRDLVISDHSLLRVYQNKMTEEMVQRLYRKSRRVLIPNKRYWAKFKKYGKSKQMTVDYYWALGYLLTVDRKDNVLISIHRQPAYSVRFC